MAFSIWNIMKEIKNLNELKKGTQLYDSVKKGNICISLDNEVRKDDDVFVNEFLIMRRNSIDYINSYIGQKFDDEYFISLVPKEKDGLLHVEYKMEMKKILMLLKFRRVYNCIILHQILMVNLRSCCCRIKDKVDLIQPFK